MNDKKNKALVHVRVTRHTLQGLHVTLKNGETGLIRAREISWNDNDIAHWRETHPVGWEGYAFPIPAKKEKKDEIPEFSLRFVEYDPWEDFFEGLDKNRPCVGTVTGVYDYGAFLEIEPGISGLLHKSQLPHDTKSPVPETFWRGDKVAVLMHEVNHDFRHIGFSLAPPQSLTDGNLPIERYSIAGSLEAEWELERLLNSEFPSNRILVIEDEPSQSIAMCGWLRDFGQIVEAFSSAEDALPFLSKSEADIALIDVGLPGMNGIELAHILLKDHPQMRVVNMTDWARARDIHANLDEIQQHGGKVLYKPFLPEDLANFLLHDRDHGNLAGEYRLETPKTRPVNIKSGKDIHRLLAMCRKKLDMEQIFLFALDPAHRSISIHDRVGDSIGNRSAIPGLIYSPVRDAAESGEVFFVNEIGEKERKRFQYLLEFAPLTTAYIGVPIPTKSPIKYALFAMDRNLQEFGDEIKMYMEGMALAIGATLDQISLRDHAALIQRSALMGNLTSGMIHEINNLVGPLHYSANHLRRSLAQMEKNVDHDPEAMKSEIANIERDIRQVIATIKTFGRIAKKPREEILKVDEIIDETITLLTHLSKRAKIKVFFTPPERIIIVRNQAVLLEQIILNVSLNAIQQTSEHRPDGGGAIRIDIELMEESGEDATCRILIRDNGPGIHAALWEKIFEMGYSTREDGSGIGLYVSRNLMEEIDGKIYVADSHILSGSIFALEFPVNF